MSQTQLAKAVQPSQSRVAKMEAGDPTVSLDLLLRSFLALGASNRDLGQIIGKGWLLDYNPLEGVDFAQRP
jgi:predicted transcriptional regulator